MVHLEAHLKVVAGVQLSRRGGFPYLDELALDPGFGGEGVYPTNKFVLLGGVQEVGGDVVNIGHGLARYPLLEGEGAIQEGSGEPGGVNSLNNHLVVGIDVEVLRKRRGAPRSSTPITHATETHAEPTG